MRAPAQLTYPLALALWCITFLTSCATPHRAAQSDIPKAPQAVEGSEGLSASPGCSGALPNGIDWKSWIEPAAPGKPQPKFTCDERDVRTEQPTWRGQNAVLVWQVRNAGDAPLKLHLRRDG
jgi:hypothetical protein